ncbi:MAG: hypothetical protein GY805_26905 [Chloroflexi bacterium]|nr:hypothetical protein [Chloroflexota bacterium]
MLSVRWKTAVSHQLKLCAGCGEERPFSPNSSCHHLQFAYNESVIKHPV